MTNRRRRRRPRVGRREPVCLVTTAAAAQAAACRCFVRRRLGLRHANRVTVRLAAAYIPQGACCTDDIPSQANRAVTQEHVACTRDATSSCKQHHHLSRRLDSDERAEKRAFCKTLSSCCCCAKAPERGSCRCSAVSMEPKISRIGSGYEESSESTQVRPKRAAAQARGTDRRTAAVRPA